MSILIQDTKLLQQVFPNVPEEDLAALCSSHDLEGTIPLLLCDEEKPDLPCTSESGPSGTYDKSLDCLEGLLAYQASVTLNPSGKAWISLRKGATMAENTAFVQVCQEQTR